MVTLSSVGRTAFRRTAPLFALLLALVVFGCGPRYIIPPQGDVTAQFALAVNQERQLLAAHNQGRKGEILERAIAAYERVIDLYPDDEAWTSRSRLRIAVLHREAGQTGKARRELESIIEEFPDDDMLVGQAMYIAALIHDQNLNFDKAIYYYTEILARYGEDDRPILRGIVKGSRLALQQIRKR